jgi:FKBP-type peptidyl-prolyl cis-trans isomerase
LNRPAIFALQLLKMKFLIPVLFLFASTASFGQTKKTPAKPATVAVNPLKTKADSLSYAIGISVVNFYSEQGVNNLNASMLAKAINDVKGKKKPLLSADDANLVLMCHSNPQLCENVKEGEAFLEANKKKNAKLKTTASGLQYEVIQMGTGIKPGPVDTVKVNYVGTLINGEEFDNSFRRGQPITFALNGVIAGWTEGLQLMPAGSKYKLYIPQKLGYGLNDMGRIPGGSTLVFEIELLEVKPKR